MRKPQSSRTIAAILILLIFLLSISLTASERLRSSITSAFHPLWQKVDSIKQYIGFLEYSDDIYLSHDTPLSKTEELQRLQLQNLLLQQKLEATLEILRLHQEIPAHSNLAMHEILPARVIYRSPAAWNSSLWINVGEFDNRRLNRQIVAHNSPVLVGLSIVGVVEEVREYQSRVRLITDSGLTPAVRASRGGKQEKYLVEILDNLKHILQSDESIFTQSADKDHFLGEIQNLLHRLENERQTIYLAKGELQGTSHPIWRTGGQVLHGIGFNYDFSDNEGPKRDLRTGKIIGSANDDSAIPLLKINDLLVTTGMDGVFPAGLQAARVTLIKPLREGDYYYEIEALPTAGNLSDISTVFVIPPISRN